MMLPEARLDVVLRIAGGSVAGLRIHSTRLVQASRLFTGRVPDEVLALLPTVFSLCGTAQAMAGLAAMEGAAGVRVPPPQAAARRALVLAETVGEHGLGVARDWPGLIGEEQDLGAARRIRTAMTAVRSALYPDGDWRTIGGGALAPNRGAVHSAIALARDVVADLLGADPGSILRDLGAFRAWLAAPRGSAGRLLAYIATHGWAGFGAAAFVPMPDGGPPDLGARLAADHSGSYLARPDSDGVVYETGPLSRRHDHPLIAALLAEHGTGLLPRLAARLVDMVETLREMAELMQDLAVAATGEAHGGGIGFVEAARGQLVHRVELEDGRVKRYQILAPTEWNFHPEGALARGLAGVAAGPEVEAHARLLAHALDPCVTCTIRVEPADA